MDDSGALWHWVELELPAWGWVDMLSVDDPGADLLLSQFVSTGLRPGGDVPGDPQGVAGVDTRGVAPDPEDTGVARKPVLPMLSRFNDGRFMSSVS